MSDKQVIQVIRKVSEMQQRSDEARRLGQKVVLVPTMGYLHEGHLSLCRIAREIGDLVVISIFVNPTQFGPREDLERYPRDTEGDLKKSASCGVDVAFVPTAEEMYPDGHQTHVEVERLSKPLCGASRPVHFKGVATVVSKLFNAVKPHAAVFGEKDYQQLQVIRRMTADLDFDVEIVAGPTFREPDGLAMSSRNAYLSASERAQATCLYRGLQEARRLFKAGERNAEPLLAGAKKPVDAAPDARVDYIELRDADTLETVATVQRPVVLAMAVFMGKTRLIDNTVLGR